MASRILRRPDQVDEFVRDLVGMKLPITVSWVKGADRTDAQNRLQWLWAAEASRYRGDCAPEDVQAEWKLHIGVPILRGEDDVFRAEYDDMVKPLPYEAKIRLMKMGFAVTSRMKARQMVNYMDEVWRVSRAEGIDLTEPDPELSAYHERVRARGARAAA